MSDDLKARLRSDSYAKPSFPIDARDAMLKAADRIEELERQVAAWDGRQAGSASVIQQLECRTKTD